MTPPPAPAAHTPGPWAVEQGEHPHNGQTVITARHAGLTARSPLAHLSNLLGADECAPDARLIASAPALLAALEGLLKASEAVACDYPPTMWIDATDAARTAIRAARGEG